MNEEMINFQDIPTVSESFSFEFKNAGYMLNGQIYTANVKSIEEEPTLLRDILAKNVAEDYYLGEKLEKWEYLKGAKKIERTSKQVIAISSAKGRLRSLILLMLRHVQCLHQSRV